MSSLRPPGGKWAPHADDGPVPLAHVVPLSSVDAAAQGACLKTSPKGCEHPHVRFVPEADIRQAALFTAAAATAATAWGGRVGARNAN
jgi:hypothetical protein